MGDNASNNILGGDIQPEPDRIEVNQSDDPICIAWKRSNLLVFGKFFTFRLSDRTDLTYCI